MTCIIVRQPTGVYAQFCSVAHDFVAYDLSRDDAVSLCRDGGTKVDAERLVTDADVSPNRFDALIADIVKNRGEHHAHYRISMLSRGKLPMNRRHRTPASQFAR